MAAYSNSYLVELEDRTQVLVPVSTPIKPLGVKGVIAKDGENLFHLSDRIFRSTYLWYVIAEMNNLEDLIELETGQELKIPIDG